MTQTDDRRPARGTHRAAGSGAPRGGQRRHLAEAVALVAVLLLLRAFVLAFYPVTSDSMAPTIERGDHVLVARTAVPGVDVGRGDLVTFHAPGQEGLLVKRVVAVAGDRVTIEDAVLVVNRRPVREPYVDYSRVDALYFGPVIVPPGHVFVLGDNRFGSIDSRVYGAVPLSSVTGRVLLVLP